jgi:dihydroneopterin triphosphate diphosphatase
MEIRGQYIECHILRRNGETWEFLLLRRAEGEIYPGIWQMVTGGIEAGEVAYKAALREMKEETGLVPEKFYTLPMISSFYSPHSDTINFLPVFLAIAGSEQSVRISGEHSEFVWVSGEKAKELMIWEGQKKGVDYILDNYVNNFREDAAFNLEIVL